VKVLCAATKAPWPPRDGGRLLLLETLKALAAVDQRVDLVAPVDPDVDDPATIERELAPYCAPHLVASGTPGTFATLLRGACTGTPLSIARHARASVRERVARLLEKHSYAVVHAEQLQALDACALATRRGIPVVLRAQNVESDLWSVRGKGFGRLLFGLEGSRLAAWERRALTRVAATLALTAGDAERLRALDGRSALHVVRAPFPGVLPAGPEALPGKPCVVLLGSAGWGPNEDGAAWFLDEMWPEIIRRLPAAEVHVFGLRGQGPGIHVHPAPAESCRAFPPDGVMVVPLRTASGVRMKILEAWARGVPVVATPEAAAGLDFEDGRDLLLARDGAGFAQALASLHAHSGTRGRLVEAGRAALRNHHDPTRIAKAIVAVYEQARRGTAR
jgi:hypothetical protein